MCGEDSAHKEILEGEGAVTVCNDPKFHFRFVNWFNTKPFLSFLDQLISRYKNKKIHLILDNAKYHKGPKVTKWLNGKEDRIELHYLPPYSPKFNTVEYIWKETRRKTTHNRFFKTLSELKQRLFRRFNRFQGNPESLRSVLESFA